MKVFNEWYEENIEEQKELFLDTFTEDQLKEFVRDFNGADFYSVFDTDLDEYIAESFENRQCAGCHKILPDDRLMFCEGCE